MSETAIALASVPRKPVVSADNNVQSVPLTLVVIDYESVAELLQKTEGRERDEYQSRRTVGWRENSRPVAPS
jgi:hypothetical protein